MNEQRPPHARSDIRNRLQDCDLVLDADNYVRWHRRNPGHPRNWTPQRKAYDIGIIMGLEFFNAAMSTVGTAVADQARHDYAISQTVGYFVFTTVSAASPFVSWLLLWHTLTRCSYLIGECVGGVFLPPISETFGRKPLYVTASIVSCAFSALIASVPSSAKGSLTMVVVGRLFCGIASSTPATIAPGSLEDIYTPEHRLWGVFAWTTASNLGLVFGPIFSSYVTAYWGWRCVFYVATVILGLGVFISLGLRESRTNLLLQRKINALQAEIGDHALRIHNADEMITFQTWVQDALMRPLRLLVTEPIVILCSALNAISFSLIYGLTEALTIVYTSFGFSAQASSLAFIPIMIGVLTSVFSRVYDQRRLDRLRRNRILLTPESKIASFAVAVPALAIGLWWFAWSIPPVVTNVPWIVSMLALVLVGFATNDLDTVLCGYMADSYTVYAASAFSALTLLRALLSGVLPLFAGIMFTGLGSNIAASILAAIATAFCVSPFVLLRHGQALRERSVFAKYSLDVSLEALPEEGDQLAEIGMLIVDEREVETML